MNQQQNNTTKQPQRVVELRQHAREIAEMLSELPGLSRGSKITVFTSSCHIPSVDVGGIAWSFVTPYKMTWSLLRAGADAGYWTYPQRVKRFDGQLFCYVVGWLGV